MYQSTPNMLARMTSKVLKDLFGLTDEETRELESHMRVVARTKLAAAGLTPEQFESPTARHLIEEAVRKLDE